MIKLTVLYGQPTDKEAFEDYYANTHLPLVAKMSGHTRTEFTIFMNQSDNSSAFYRMAEFWFSNPETMEATMSSPEGQATAADLGNFATGGVTVLVGFATEMA
ncbi:EthD family reductase [soil metagenome]